MYERFYRLRERPFALTPDPDYLYPSRVHREALNYLRYGIESHAGFIVITGAIGSGKTTLLQTLLRGLDHTTTVARVMNTLLDPRELIEAAMIDVGLDSDGKSKPAMLKAFGEFLVNERLAGHLVLLVIDEAQNLSLPALEEIRMLSNLETEKSKLLQIILIGQPDLRDKLDRPELEQLRQRITVSYHLEPIDADETAQYINHRLARAAIGAPIAFPRAVTDPIHARSGGVPRLINVIADATLVFGYGEEKYDIDAALIEEVISDLDATGVLGPRSNPERHESVVPADPNLMPRPVATPSPRTAEDVLHARAIAEREKIVAQREIDLAAREREVTEQRRVLAEQYRLLKSQPAVAAIAAPPPAAPPWKPATQVVTPAPMPVSPAAALVAAAMHEAQARPMPMATVQRPPAPRQPSFKSIHVKRRPTMWRRIKDTLLGAEPVLEDSL